MVGPIDTCRRALRITIAFIWSKFILFSDLLHWDVVTKLAHTKRILIMDLLKKMAPDK